MSRVALCDAEDRESLAGATIMIQASETSHKILLALVLMSIGQFANAGAHTESAAAGNGMPDVPLIETESFGDGLYAFRWGPYRNIFVVTNGGVIATDPLGVRAAEAYRAAIREVTDKPVKYVLYSHSHWDHVAGGRVFKDEGATFISQENCARNLRWSPNPDVVAPDITFEASHTLKLGEQTVEMHHYGPIHDNCMSVMLIRPANKIFVVDIVSPPTGRYMPFDDINDPHQHLGNTSAYLRSVEELAARNGITTIVGGHLVVGEDETGKQKIYPSTGPVTAIAERREFYEQMLTAVKAQLDAGVPILQVHNAVDLEPFHDLRGFDEEKMRRILQRVAYFYVLGR